MSIKVLVAILMAIPRYPLAASNNAWNAVWAVEMICAAAWYAC
jgi:hypothetical protein